MGALILGLFFLDGSARIDADDEVADQSPPPGREYFSVDVGPLVAEFSAEQILSNKPITQNAWYQSDTSPIVSISPDSEAYLLVPENRDNDFFGYRVVGVKPQGANVAGQLIVLRRDREMPRESVMVRIDFEAGSNEATNGTREDFLLAKGQYFQRLWSEQMAGSAMFRHLATSALAEVGDTAVNRGPNWRRTGRSGVDQTIRLMSGGRAVSENLQLDRQLATTAEQTELQSLADVKGITVREIDWTGRLRDEKTELDFLASHVPHDQYAVFLPSFETFANMIQQGSHLARPAVQWLEPQSRATDVLGFYQQQLGLPLNALARQVGGALVDEVALTGSDPYFRTGTDLAVLMKTDQPTLLYQAITTQIAALAAQQSDVVRAQYTVSEHDVMQWSTKDRRFCSFVAVADKVVIVTNSLVQMTEILRCADQQQLSLSSLDEYRFFANAIPVAPQTNQR